MAGLCFYKNYFCKRNNIRPIISILANEVSFPRSHHWGMKKEEEEKEEEKQEEEEEQEEEQEEEEEEEEEEKEEEEE